MSDIKEVKKRLRTLSEELEDSCINSTCSHFFRDDECRLCILEYLSTHNRLRPDLLQHHPKTGGKQ